MTHTRTVRQASPRRPRTYVIELHGGRMGLCAARDLARARTAALRRCGTENVARVRLATADDIAWVRGMGGYVPVTRGAR